MPRHGRQLQRLLSVPAGQHVTLPPSPTPAHPPEPTHTAPAAPSPVLVIPVLWPTLGYASYVRWRVPAVSFLRLALFALPFNYRWGLRGPRNQAHAWAAAGHACLPVEGCPRGAALCVRAQLMLSGGRQLAAALPTRSHALLCAASCCSTAVLDAMAPEVNRGRLALVSNGFQLFMSE